MKEEKGQSNQLLDKVISDIDVDNLRNSIRNQRPSNKVLYKQKNDIYATFYTLNSNTIDNALTEDPLDQLEKQLVKQCIDNDQNLDLTKYQEQKQVSDWQCELSYRISLIQCHNKIINLH